MCLLDAFQPQTSVHEAHRLARQDLSCTYLAHDELESVLIISIIIVVIIIIIIIMDIAAALHAISEHWSHQ